MKERFRAATPDLLIAALLLIIPLLLFLPQTLGGRTLVPTENLYLWEPYASLRDDLGVGRPQNVLVSDLILENYVWKTFARDELLQGRLPLWQPYILSGTPFLAAGQSSALYPLNLLWLLMPATAAYGWYTVISLWIAGLGMFLLARVLGIGRAGALIAALTYELSGWFLGGFLFTMILATSIWLPWLLASIELTIRRAPLMGRPASLPWVALGAVLLGVAVLGGHLEALYFTLLVMGFYAAWRLIAQAIHHFRSDLAPLTPLLTSALWLLALLGLGLALGAVQILPGYELASQSARIGGDTLEEILGFAYPTRHLLAFLMPNFYGNPGHHFVFDLFDWRWVAITQNSFGQPVRSTEWGIKNFVEGAAYLGILPMLLALIGAAGWILGLHRGQDASRTRPLWIALATLSLLIAFGTPLYALLYHTLPFIDQSRAIFRWVWPLTISVAALAGFGWETLASHEFQVTSTGAAGGRQQAIQMGLRALRLLPTAALIGGGLILLGIIGARLAYGQIEGLVQRLFEGLALAAYAFPDPRTFFSYEALNVGLFGIILIAAGSILLWVRSVQHADDVPPPLSDLASGRGQERVTPDTRLALRRLAPLAAAVALIALDMGLPWLDHFPRSDPALLDALPASIAWLQSQREAVGPFRVMAYENPGADTFNANMGWLHGIEDVAGYDSLIPAQYAAYMSTIQPQGDLPYNRIAPLYATSPQSLDSPMLDLLNLRYVLSEVPIENPKYALAYQDEALYIYENLGAAPRAFTLPVTATIADSDFASAAMRYDLRQYVIVDPADADFVDGAGPTPGGMQAAAITIHDTAEVWVDVDTPLVSWLVLSDSYYPGWRAWVRPLGADESQETEVPVIRADGAFRAVLLQPGQWTVRFKYSPDSVRFGAFTSFLSGLLIIFMGAIWAWRTAYPAVGAEGQAGRVARNTLAPILLNLFNKGILFALTFVSLRLLGPEGAGEYRYAVVIWGWFEVVTNFGLNTFLTREVARDRNQANRYLATTTTLRLIFAALGIPVLFAFVLIRGALVQPPLSPSLIGALLLLYGGLFFSTISTGLTALFYAYERAEIPAVTATISAFLTAAAGVLALLSGGGVIGLAAVSAGVNLVTLILLGVLASRLFFRPRLEFDQGLASSALGESFPLMLNHLLATLFFRINVVLLEALKGPLVVGWYSVVYTWVDTIGIIPAFFTQALFPSMSRQALEDRPALQRSWYVGLKVMSLIITPLAVVTSLLATPMINILGGPQYLPHGAIALSVFIWAMVIGWVNSVTQYVIIALNRQRTLTWAFIIGAAFNVIANLILIPRWSYLAAALVAICSEIVLLGCFTIVLRAELPNANPLTPVWRVWLAGAAMAGAAWLAAHTWGMWIGLLACLPVYLGALLLLRPFSAEEMDSAGRFIPGPLRRLLARRSTSD